MNQQANEITSFNRPAMSEEEKELYGQLRSHQQSGYQHMSIFDALRISDMLQYQGIHIHFMDLRMFRIHNAFLGGKTIGEGSFGKVFIGQEKLSQMKVAIKQLKADTPEERQAISHETRLMTKLEHPCIGRLLDVDTKYQPQSKTVSLVMEFIPGKDGKALIKEIGSGLNIPTTKVVMRQFLSGLSDMHKNGIIHRDIKPDNLMISSDHDEFPWFCATDWKFKSLEHEHEALSSLRVQIIDLGLADEVDDEGFMPNTAQGNIPSWGPEILEILRAGQRAGGQTNRVKGRPADIYGAGILLYQLVANRQFPLPIERIRPFQEDAEIATMLLAYNPANRHNVPSSVWSLVELMLQKDPAQRPTADEVLQHPWFSDAFTKCTDENVPRVVAESGVYDERFLIKQLTEEEQMKLVRMAVNVMVRRPRSKLTFNSVGYAMYVLKDPHVKASVMLSVKCLLRSFVDETGIAANFNRQLQLLRIFIDWHHDLHFEGTVLEDGDSSDFFPDPTKSAQVPETTPGETEVVGEIAPQTKEEVSETVEAVLITDNEPAPEVNEESVVDASYPKLAEAVLEKDAMIAEESDLKAVDKSGLDVPVVAISEPETLQTLADDLKDGEDEIQDRFYEWFENDVEPDCPEDFSSDPVIHPQIESPPIVPYVDRQSEGGLRGQTDESLDDAHELAAQPNPTVKTASGVVMDGPHLRVFYGCTMRLYHGVTPRLLRDVEPVRIRSRNSPNPPTSPLN